MSYNPVAKQATAANANKTNAVASTNDASATAGADDSMFKTRTFDVFWVDKTALMYKDGFAKVRQSYRIEYGAFCAGVWSGAFLHSFIPKFLMIFRVISSSTLFAMLFTADFQQGNTYYHTCNQAKIFNPRYPP